MFNNDAVTTSRPRISCSFRAFETKKTEKNALIALQCLSVCNNSRKTEQGFAEFVILHQSLYAIMYIKPTNMSVEQTFCRTYTGTKSVTHWHNVSHKMALRQSQTGTTSVTKWHYVSHTLAQRQSQNGTKSVTHWQYVSHTKAMTATADGSRQDTRLLCERLDWELYKQSTRNKFREIHRLRKRAAIDQSV
jgi:hypothetical protein